MIAYLILAHNNPHQVIALANKLKSPNSIVLVHLDKRADTEIINQLNTCPNLQLIIERHPVYWGGFSMVEATLALLKAGVKRTNVERLVLLSGACWPAKSMKQVEDVILKDCDYINIGKQPVDPSHRFVSRFTDYHPMDINSYNPQTRKNNYESIYTLNFAKQLPKRELPKDMAIYVGANWFSLKRSTVQTIFDNTTLLSRAKELFRYTAHPDEAFFQTILMKLVEDNQLSKSLISSNLHYSDFKNKGRVGGLPKILDETDADAIRLSDKLFARKIDPIVSADLIEFLEKLNSSIDI